MEPAIWTEERIRAEIRRLDGFTGLHGYTLPIAFSNSRSVLGMFSPPLNRLACFTFSNFFFQDPAFPPEEALDVIRHEYAHYMDFVLYGKSGHGPTWKACCCRVGARPFRLYRDFYTQYHRELRRQTEAQQSRILAAFAEGTTLVHPVFGPGQVVRVTQQQTQPRLEIRFAGGGTRCFSAGWCLAHCSGITAPPGGAG